MSFRMKSFSERNMRDFNLEPEMQCFAHSAKIFMTMPSDRNSLLQIHIAVFLFGLAGLLGKLLPLSPVVIVFGRTLFAAASLFIFSFSIRVDLRLRSGRQCLTFLCLGALLAVHWVTFFHSVQVSTVAVGLLSFSTFPVFATFIEPWFFRERLRRFDIAAAFIVLAGLWLIIPAFDFEDSITKGAFWGTVSGFTFALLSILNRKFVQSGSSIAIAFYQNAFASLWLLPFSLGAVQSVSAGDIVIMAFLGIVCTAAAHALFINSLVGIKAQLAGIIACLEPVYGTLLAMLFIGEIPGLRTVAGGAVILGGVVWATTWRAK